MGYVWDHKKCDTINVKRDPPTTHFQCVQDGERGEWMNEQNVGNINIGRPSTLELVHRDGSVSHTNMIEVDSRHPEYVSMGGVTEIRPGKK